MNRIGRARLAIAVAGCVFLAGSGCGDSESSTDIATDAMTAIFSATANGNGITNVRAELRIPGDHILDDYVNLNRGDRLIAKRTYPITLRDNERLMFEHHRFGDSTYGVGFRDQEKDSVIEIAFDRSATGGVSANASSVTLPAPFELDWEEDPLTTNSAPRSFSRSSATPYFVVWDPFGAPEFEPGDALSFRVTGNCIQTFQGFIDWPGGEDSLQLTGVLDDREPPNDEKSCPLRVEFTLSRAGTVDPAFAGGSFVARQVRFLKLSSEP